jgi:hypothetical protein
MTESAEYVRVDEPTQCLRLRVVFMGGEEREYPIHGGGDWSYREQPDRLIVRPYGKQGNARHEIPLRNVLSVMVVGMAALTGGRAEICADD